jgi:nucleotide-binding universal stress UspA family protein/predicted transcriptional regulator
MVKKSLVVALDGSERGEAVLPWATYLARTHGLTLVLGRVVPWPIYAGMDGMGGYITPELFDEMIQAGREAATSYLEGLRDQLAPTGLTVELQVREGSAAEGILDLADDVGALAVVMSTHGRGGVTRLVLGSVAERVLQLATVPILLVRATGAETAATPGLQRLLVPLDGSALAEAALDVALDVAEPGATVLLTRVVRPVEFEVLGSAGLDSEINQVATDRAVAEAQDYLARLQQARGGGQATIQALVALGRAADQILQAAREQSSDLIVMATHGDTGPARWFIGSVADEVLRHADRPILLVSARALAVAATGSFTVADLMTRDLAALDPEDSLIAAIHKLLRRGVSGAPVVDKNGALVGVISEYDLLDWQGKLIESVQREAVAGRADYARRLESTTVREVMSQPPVAIEESTPLNEAIDLFRHHGRRRLPVTREGRLVGILTRGDIMRSMAAQWQAAQPAS